MDNRGLERARTGKEPPVSVERPLMLGENNQVDSLHVPDDCHEQIADHIRTRIATALNYARQVVDLGCGSC